MVLIFLFGPVRGFLVSFKRISEERGIYNEEREKTQFIELTPQLPYYEKKKKPFSFVNEENIGAFAFALRRESPEKIATVLGFLDENLIKKALEYFPEDIQDEIILELSKENEVSYKEIEEMEEELEKRMMMVIGGKEKIIRILEELDPSKREHFLSFLSVEVPELSEELRNLVLSFDDIERFSFKELKKIIDNVDVRILIKALKFAKDSIRERFFSILSPKTVKYIKNEMNDEGITPEVSKKAQIELVRRIREMIEKGIL